VNPGADGHDAVAVWLHLGLRLESYRMRLFALNQPATSIPVVANETAGAEYLLRVRGFIVILAAIVDKNLVARRQ
jgi:hypothetical protein